MPYKDREDRKAFDRERYRRKREEQYGKGGGNGIEKRKLEGWLYGPEIRARMSQKKDPENKQSERFQGMFTPREAAELDAFVAWINADSRRRQEYWKKRGKDSRAHISRSAMVHEGAMLWLARCRILYMGEAE